MKKRNIKNKVLIQLIQEALDNFLYLTEDDEPGEEPQLSWLSGQGAQDIDRREAEKNKSFYDESEGSLPWDDRIEELANLLHGIGLDVIDHYKGRPGFTKEAARHEILSAVGVPLDVFYGNDSEFGNFYSIDRLLNEEFEDVNENYAELGDLGVASVNINDDSNEANMGDISEDRKK